MGNTCFTNNPPELPFSRNLWFCYCAKVCGHFSCVIVKPGFTIWFPYFLSPTARHKYRFQLQRNCSPGEVSGITLALYCPYACVRYSGPLSFSRRNRIALRASFHP